MVNEKLQIPPYAKLRINWLDRPENYSKEAKLKIRNHFANKYGIPKDNINVIYQPIKIGKNGEQIEISGSGIDNIMDSNYQRQLFKEWLNREGITIDFERLLKLDDKVNAELNLDGNVKHHKEWSLKWLMIDGFLCFGENNFVSLSKLSGLVIVNSLPENFGGKSTFSVDAFKFLLFGKTTKTDKNEQVFNSYLNKDSLSVRGMLDIGGEEVIIERTMSRNLKKDGTWAVRNLVNYYKILPDGEEVLLNEEDAKITTKQIREMVGSEEDFEMVILATARNLEDLIGLTSTESGKLLTRFIGLEVIELKEQAVRKMYNEFAKTMKSNEYNIVALLEEIETHKSNIETATSIHGELKIKYELTLAEIIRLNGEKDRLIGSKKQIDAIVNSLNPSKLDIEIKEALDKGLKFKEKVERIKIRLNEIGQLKFDEDRHHELTTNLNKYTTQIALNDAEIARLKVSIKSLVDGGICQTCHRKLDNVDNTEHIKHHTNTIAEKEVSTNNLRGMIEEINKEIVGLNETKKLIDEKNKLELDKDRAEVEMGGLRNTITEKKADLVKYKSNLSGIEFNRQVDTDVDMVKTNILVTEHTKTEIIQKIERIKVDISQNEKEVIRKGGLIEQIKKEDEIDKVFKIYIDMIGKKGISKLVLRSVLPIINGEVQRLLEDVTDFEVEIFMNDKNDVEFHLITDDVVKLLKSGSGFEMTAASLALRCVLGKMSNLPMPNFITFDEVLGKVANTNIPAMKPLFDKIAKMYDIIFLITHNPLVAEWNDSTITVIKENNISRLTIK